MKKQIDVSKIREIWQPLTEKELSDGDCEQICDDIGGFFQALKRMKSELDHIQKMKEAWSEYTGEEVDDSQAAEILNNTQAFVQQVIKMKRLIDEKENGECNAKK